MILNLTKEWNFSFFFLLFKQYDQQHMMPSHLNYILLIHDEKNFLMSTTT